MPFLAFPSVAHAEHCSTEGLRGQASASTNNNTLHIKTNSISMLMAERVLLESSGQLISMSHCS